MSCGLVARARVTHPEALQLFVHRPTRTCSARLHVLQSHPLAHVTLARITHPKALQL
jgi:hypothetical protein